MMAPAARTRSSLYREAATDSEDDLATANARTENRRMNANATKNSKSKTMPRRASAGKTAPKRKAAPKQNRPALKDRTNIQHGSDTEEVENFDDEEMDVDGGKPKAKRAKTATAARKQPTSRAASEPGKMKTMTKAAADALGIIPETQPDPEMEDVSQSIEVDADEMDLSTVPTPKPVKKFAQRARSASVQPLQLRASARAGSVQPAYPPPRERSASASGTERERRGGDPEVRRKLNDVTKKYENLNLKYQNLQEIGRGNAESNFEKLKRASDQKAKDANDLIASLKKELAELKKGGSSSSSSSTSSSEIAGLQKQVSTIITSNEKLTTENASLKNALQLSQNEVKSLEAKFVAARQQISTSTQESKVPGSAATTKGLDRSVGPNATDAQKEARMKENLYSDLTGLIIRGVKRKEGEDEYDCIQTGRNGSTYSPINNLTYTDMFSSPSLPPLHRQRRQHRQSQDALRPLIRGSRVRVRATARREQRPRADGASAGLSDRGDLLPEESCGEVLHEGRG